MTRTQRGILMAYKSFRDSPPTLGTLLGRLLRSWLLLFVVGALLAGLGIATGLQLVIGLAFGLFVGACARDVGTCLKTAAFWPTMKEIINWDRVEQLLNQDRVGDLS